MRAERDAGGCSPGSPPGLAGAAGPRGRSTVAARAKFLVAAVATETLRNAAPAPAVDAVVASARLLVADAAATTEAPRNAAPAPAVDARARLLVALVAATTETPRNAAPAPAARSDSAARHRAGGVGSRGGGAVETGVVIDAGNKNSSASSGAASSDGCARGSGNGSDAATAGGSGTGFGSGGAAATPGSGRRGWTTTLPSFGIAASRSRGDCRGGEGGEDASSAERDTGSRVKRGASPGIAPCFVSGAGAGGAPNRRGELPNPAAGAWRRGSSDARDADSDGGGAAASGGAAAPLSTSLVKSTHWMSRQRGSARCARPAAPKAGRRARAVPAAGAKASPGDIWRGVSTPCSLVRLFGSRKAARLPGEIVESGMTVGFRLSAVVFNSLRSRDASRSVRLDAAPSNCAMHMHCIGEKRKTTPAAKTQGRF